MLSPVSVVAVLSVLAVLHALGRGATAERPPIVGSLGAAIRPTAPVLTASRGRSSRV